MPRAPKPLSAPLPPRLDADGDGIQLITEPTGAEPVLEGARLDGLELAGAQLRGLRWIDVAVERGNLANLVAPELTLRRVTVSGARLTGAQWTRGSLID